ncbi:DoxX family protein [Glycomyces tritici]|uniref:DoxX family protein n=1 Tax=Glycomyces tritici TaxID=2665176 RepID=A0ABT7YWX3_9ACTN|nr:DoxX family protein [Glycomyces tritici]MDN3243144.1 DoxX family protein [Glycomyces tritici]
MHLALWITASLLALVFLLAGTLTLFSGKDKLQSSGMTWVEDFPNGVVKAIGAVEVLGAAGLILPAVLDTATVLVPIAAVGAAVLMVGAAITHARRGEFAAIAVNAVLFALAAFTAWGRFGLGNF